VHGAGEKAQIKAVILVTVALIAQIALGVIIGGLMSRSRPAETATNYRTRCSRFEADVAVALLPFGGATQLISKMAIAAAD